MIDLHCHLLPGIDDGAVDLATSLAMARIAVADGIAASACTSHILPGVYNNTGPSLLAAIEQLQRAIEEAGIPLKLVSGADVHVAPNLAAQLADERALRLHHSRYFLLEPPHHSLPPRFEEFTFGLLAAGYVPIITHPERLSWIEHYYGLIQKLVAGGCLMQLTAGSLTGGFGRRARYWAERILDEGMCHILATDAHDTKHRPPVLSAARDLAAQRVSEAEARRFVWDLPLAILKNLPHSELPASSRPVSPSGSSEQARQPDRRRLWPFRWSKSRSGKTPKISAE